MSNDMTFCGGAACPLKLNCRRYKNEVKVGEVNLYYFIAIPYNKQTNDCEMLIPIDIGKTE
jgi:hypothetical protein